MSVAPNETTQQPVEAAITPKAETTKTVTTGAVNASPVTASTAATPSVNPAPVGHEKKMSPFFIEKISTRRRYLKALIYGGYGAGKTHFAGTSFFIPTFRDILFISAEAGDLTLVQLGQEFLDNVDIVTVQDFTTFARIYEFLQLHIRFRDSNDTDNLKKLQDVVMPSGSDKLKKYHTIIIDYITEVQRYCMKSLMGWDPKTATLDVSPDSPEFKQWGQNSAVIINLIRAYRDLGINVIMTCSQKEERDESKRRYFYPNLPGKLSNDAQGFFDVVGYLAVGKAPEAKPGDTLKASPRRLFLSETQFFNAKSRIAGNVQWIDDPTVEKLLTTREQVIPSPQTTPQSSSTEGNK